MTLLTESQQDDLRELLEHCRTLHVEAVIIGATAYRLLIEDTTRTTLDIDLALAVEIDEFLQFEEVLKRSRWERSSYHEQRWTTPRGNRFDLLPAGPALQQQGKVVWPRSRFEMSLAGFEHVFRHAVTQQVGGGIEARVIPPKVLALLKVVAYMERPDAREKDLSDLGRIFRWYEMDSHRIFDDEVLDAELPDIEFANAFLLGLDLAAIATPTDRDNVEAFLKKMSQTMSPDADRGREDEASTEIRFSEQLRAFTKGFRLSRRQH